MWPRHRPVMPTSRQPANIPPQRCGTVGSLAVYDEEEVTDTGLLLLIIVEVYQTVLAYLEENSTRVIVQLVIYTGVIAMVRKAIIFRTGEYATVQDALLAAGAYAIIIFALVGLLFAERVYGSDSMLLSGD